jgi:hypothetical protein
MDFSTRGSMTAHVEASPEAVYGIVSDVTRRIAPAARGRAGFGQLNSMKHLV